MKQLFRLATNYFTLDWHRVSEQDHAVLATSLPVMGRLKLTQLAPGLEWYDRTMRRGVPDILAADIDDPNGPPLFEQTDYQLYLRAENADDQIEIRHRDPLIAKSLSTQENGRVVHGVVNFRGQIGRSQFSIYINGTPLLDFEVEVFPTKIDYDSDYQEIVADVQSILTSLAYEYLRSTYQMGKLGTGQKSSQLEWLVLIEHIISDLETALNYIANRPTRGLVRRERTTRLERIRRVDSRVRSQVRRGQGKGSLVQLDGIAARERLVQRPAELTLDTMEHRWIRNQLLEVQRTLGQISAVYDRAEELSVRKQQTSDGISRLKSRVSRLLRLEPVNEAVGDPPTGFASLQLVSAPGYRETYRLLMFLQMGMRLEGDLVKIAVKDLDVLYEYWTYLTVVRIIQDEHGPPQNLDQLFNVRQSGLSIQLKQGVGQRIAFRTGSHRRISVLYNPQFANQDTTLIPQKPDILIRFEEDGWPIIQLVLDAKYRIDATEKYRQQFKSFGPPTDAINVLHRYRDAILELDQHDNEAPGLKRSVVQAAALFPLNQLPDEDFHNSRLWQSLERLGVGAIPALPSNTVYLKEWLLASLRQGGWSLADRAIASLAEQRARDWRVAASEPVLVGVLRSPGTAEHLEWIKRERLYYKPLTKTQRRQFIAKQVALYLPSGLDEPSGIRYFADVEQIDVVDRAEIQTPWNANHREQMVLYRLGPVRSLPKPIPMTAKDKTSIVKSRWTTRLGLQRARTLGEIALETEPEWRFLEWLLANQTGYTIESHRVRVHDPSNPKGRAWFQLESGDRVRYDGINGFLWRSSSGNDRYFSLKEIIRGESI